MKINKTTFFFISSLLLLYSIQVLPLRVDVRKADDVAEAVDKLVSQFGLPDIVVNNAAGNFISPTERLSPNAFAAVIGIVLQGTANVTLDIGKRLIKEKKGFTFILPFNENLHQAVSFGKRVEMQNL